ncbi:hypothetical protein GCM10022224_072530 [Nonomuraea antimicrobica]|uniref:YcxB-like C-terminal domain-containing protein n=1 Tax=Nonomuraea antimicrobica TaxID=561173 RepID=A0ABP7CU38_9ACTN
MNFTVDYEPTPDEVARALKLGLRRQLKVPIRTLIAVLLVLGALCLLLGNLGLGIGMLAGAVVFPFALTWSIRRTARRQLGYLCIPTTIHVTDDGIDSRTEQTTTSMRWSFFSQVVHDPEFWLFFVNRQLTGFLPRRAFTQEQQAQLDTVLTPSSRTTP